MKLLFFLPEVIDIVLGLWSCCWKQNLTVKLLSFLPEIIDIVLGFWELLETKPFLLQ